MSREAIQIALLPGLEKPAVTAGDSTGDSHETE